MAPKIAIVGSGPSGCYLAQALRKKAPNAELVIFDRLPVPYGLIRYGVAPDHQGTKGVTEQFDRLFLREGVKFVGNVDVGRDVDLEELRRAFDVVVLATGVATDRNLDIPGEASPRLHRAGRVTRLFNGYPDEVRDGFELGERVAIIGHGNVALDIVRLLGKTEQDFAGSDVDDSFHQRAVRSIREIDVVGRRAAEDVKFDKTLVKELGRVDGVTFRMHGLSAARRDLDTSQQSTIDGLLELERVETSAPKRINVNFHFGWSPISIDDAPSEASVAFTSTDGSGKKLVIAADSVISAVGFAVGDRDRWNRETFMTPDADVERGKLASRLFCTGWFGKGAHGTIPEHRAESKTLAATIASEIDAMSESVEKPGLAALPAEVRNHIVNFDGWESIDAAERSAASEDRFRRKLITTQELLSAAQGSVSKSTKGANL